MGSKLKRRWPNKVLETGLFYYRRLGLGSVLTGRRRGNAPLGRGRVFTRFMSSVGSAGNGSLACNPQRVV